MRAVPVSHYDPRRSSCAMGRLLVYIGVMPDFPLPALSRRYPIKRLSACMDVLGQSLEKSGPKGQDDIIFEVGRVSGDSL
jgi:hypothetical protein